MIDYWLTRGISIFGGIAMILLTLIVFLQVITRYVFNLPIGAIEELPIYLMMIAIWTTAAINVKRKDHISLDVINFFVHNKRIKKVIDCIVEVLTSVVLIFFLRLLYRYFEFNLRSKNVTPGLEIPIYFLLLIVMVCVGMMALYSIMNAVATAKEAGAWKSE